MATITYDNPPTLHDTAGRYSHTALVEGPGRYGEAVRWLHISGQVGTRPDGTTPQDADAQVEQALKNLMAALAHHGMGPQNLVKMTSYITDRSVLASLRARRVPMLGVSCAHTLIIVAGLAAPEFLVEIEAVAAG
jgi:enamine deaminase RidA (YjgF/YER057c/UK114 family)